MNKLSPILLIFLLPAAFVTLCAQTPDDPPPLDTFQIEQENLCKTQTISRQRTYIFRTLPRAAVKDGAYGKKPWYFSLRKVFPFLANSSEDKYGIDDIRTLAEVWGRPAPLGESKKSRRIRSTAELKLAEEARRGEAAWAEWQRNNPRAAQDERDQAEMRLRFRGAATAKLTRFDWREQGLEVGAVEFQGWKCNTCWAFASVDAMQISRRLAARRASIAGEPRGARPSARQLISCMTAGADDYCGEGWHGEAFTFMVDKGLPLGGTTKYVPEKYGWGCDAESYLKALTWDFVSAVPQEIAATDDIKRAVVTYGAVVTALSFDNCLTLYGGGVFNEEQNRNARLHLVSIIGWDDEKGAWLVKNSFGADWGENGFGWIKYRSNNIGQWSAFVVADAGGEK